jgi:hypothetical protein
MGLSSLIGSMSFSSSDDVNGLRFVKGGLSGNVESVVWGFMSLMLVDKWDWIIVDKVMFLEKYLELRTISGGFGFWDGCAVKEGRV